MTAGDFTFNGRQAVSFSEASYLFKTEKHNLVSGINYLTESFIKNNTDSLQIKNYNAQTIGFFIQDGWQVFKKLMFEAGLRADHHNEQGWFVLPRVAFLYKPKTNLSFRLSSGTGYITPNIFTEEEITSRLRYLQPIDNTVQAERSFGVNCDISYKTYLFNALTVQLDQAFYYTQIDHPIIESISSNQIRLMNDNGIVNSKGTDTYLRLECKE